MLCENFDRHQVRFTQVVYKTTEVGILPGIDTKRVTILPIKYKPDIKRLTRKVM